MQLELEDVCQASLRTSQCKARRLLLRISTTYPPPKPPYTPQRGGWQRVKLPEEKVVDISNGLSLLIRGLIPQMVRAILHKRPLPLVSSYLAYIFIDVANVALLSHV
jgi:hypothetical protein